MVLDDLLMRFFLFPHEAVEPRFPMRDHFFGFVLIRLGGVCFGKSVFALLRFGFARFVPFISSGWAHQRSFFFLPPLLRMREQFQSVEGCSKRSVTFNWEFVFCGPVIP